MCGNAILAVIPAPADPPSAITNYDKFVILDVLAPVFCGKKPAKILD
jgi:hypothetical protein